MKITVDTTKCMGIGMCELTAPEVFEVNDEAQTQVVAEVDGADDKLTKLVEDAVSGCPTGALTIQR